jgi:hypothetical protein
MLDLQVGMMRIAPMPSPKSELLVSLVASIPVIFHIFATSLDRFITDRRVTHERRCTQSLTCINARERGGPYY